MALDGFHHCALVQQAHWHLGLYSETLAGQKNTHKNSMSKPSHSPKSGGKEVGILNSDSPLPPCLSSLSLLCSPGYLRLQSAGIVGLHFHIQLSGFLQAWFKVSEYRWLVKDFKCRNTKQQCIPWFSHLKSLCVERLSFSLGDRLPVVKYCCCYPYI